MIAWLAWSAFAEEPVAPAPAPEPFAVRAPAETAISASLVVAVAQQEAAAEAIVAETERLGGWFQSRTPTSLSLRVPISQAETLLAACEAQGKVLDRRFAREDLSFVLADTRAKAEARRDLLAKYQAVLATASTGAIVSVQSSIIAAIREIETLEGQIRLLSDRARYARVDVAFQFQDRSAPSRDGYSSFPWLNTLNFQDVVQGVQYRVPPWKTSPATASPPDGFSAWKKESRFRAASPDGVLYRVRVVRHKPPAELAFWKEAVRERMEAAGYKVAAETDVSANGVAGGALELLAANGTEDWTYLVAFFPNGKRLVIAEATGEVLAFEARRAAIEAAIGAIAP